MSRSITTAVAITPRVPLRTRLEALAAQCPSLDVADPLAMEATALVTAGALRAGAATAARTGTTAELLTTLPLPLLGTARLRASGGGDLAVLDAAVDVLETAECTLISEALEEVMSGLGLRTSAARDGSVAALHGQVGAQHVLAVVRDGEVVLDVLGCEGSTCEPVVNEILHGLLAKGFGLDETRGTTHADPQGGRLIAAAGRFTRSGASLEAGAVEAVRAERRTRTAATAKRRVEVRNG